jgi:2,3-bisphosphoglycerate-dependent phosphoglycerate mutase
MALDGLSPDEIVKQELATGVPIVYRLREDSSVASKRVLD